MLTKDGAKADEELAHGGGDDEMEGFSTRVEALCEGLEEGGERVAM